MGKCKNCSHDESFHINPEAHFIKERICTKAGCYCQEYGGDKQ
jgi:hypothetical protein